MPLPQQLDADRAGLLNEQPNAAQAVQARAVVRRQQLEQCLALGIAKQPQDAHVFPAIDGSVRRPDVLTQAWARAVERKLPDVTLHALRHTRVSQLIAARLDVVTISKRIGHADPAVTLRVYGHLSRTRDDRAADAVAASFRRVRRPE